MCSNAETVGKKEETAFFHLFWGFYNPNPGTAGLWPRRLKFSAMWQGYFFVGSGFSKSSLATVVVSPSEINQ